MKSRPASNIIDIAAYNMCGEGGVCVCEIEREREFQDTRPKTTLFIFGKIVQILFLGITIE